MGDTNWPGCFKYGCIGCLTLLAMGVGLVFFVGALQMTFEPEAPQQEQRQLSQDLPPGPAVPYLSDQPESSSILPLPKKPEAPQRTGTLVLDVAMVELIVEPGPEGEPIRVEADYDTNNFELVETFDTAEDGTWLYELSFKKQGSFWNFFGNNKFDNEIRLVIPRGQPIEIVGAVKLGESEMDLGGLLLQRIDLEYGLGDHFLEFREPLPFVMEQFRVDGSMGNLELRSIGNASPSSVRVGHNMGELLVDLDGHWRNDASIAVEINMGQGRVWVPDDVRVNADVDVHLGEKRLDIRDDDTLPEDTPVLSIDLEGNMGEMSIEG